VTLAAALAVLLNAGAAWAEGSPLWGSDLVRANRPLAPVEAVLFDLHREVTRPGKPRETHDAVVTLAPSFTLVAEGPGRLLEDHALCRTLAWTDGGHAVSNDSCYAAVAVREFEIQNRVLLARVVPGGKDPALQPIQTLAFSEAELNVTAPGAAPLTARRTAGGMDYLSGTTLVARVEGDAGALSPEETHRLVRFFARDANLHPQARAGLGAGRLPGRIENEAGLAGGHQVITLSHLRRAPVAYPLPAGLPSTVAEAARTGAAPRDRAIARAAAVIAGQTTKPAAADLIAAMHTASDAGHKLAVALLFLEITQEQGDLFKRAQSDPSARTLANDAAGLFRAVQADPDVAALMDANRLAGSPQEKGDRQGAARFLALSHRLDSLAFGTFRYVTYGNLLAASGDIRAWDPAIAKAMPATRTEGYWMHIAAHPWAANAYKDVGDLYLADYDVGAAWAAYDLGRAADPDWRAGVMPSLASYEDQMRAAHPDFF
jgi:hypothetical protein